MSKKPTAVETQQLKKAYGDRVALGPLDLKIPVGQQVALVGANGSGKTTLLRLIAGLLEKSSGEIEVEGHAVGTLDARAAVCFLPDEPVLYEDLSVREHVEYLAPLFGATDWQERSDTVMSRLNLAHRADDLPASFSRGLRQKTSLLLGFVRPFSVLLIDEPFVGLDEPGRLALMELLDEAKEDGATIVLASHQLEMVNRADRCVALSEGSIVFDGKPADADLKALLER